LVQPGVERIARPWAPVRLPIDRIVLGAGPAFPPGGRVDLYAGFPGFDERGLLVVLTLGVREPGRELEPAEILAALADQVRVVVADRYPCRSLVSATTAPQPASRA